MSSRAGSRRRSVTRQALEGRANMCSMTSQGSPYARFRRALATGNLTIIRAAAAELPRVDLGDALSVCMAIRAAEPMRFERAALRWLARFATEEARSIDDLRAAADAFGQMREQPEHALATLQVLVSGSAS